MEAFIFDIGECFFSVCEFLNDETFLLVRLVCKYYSDPKWKIFNNQYKVTNFVLPPPYFKIRYLLISFSEIYKDYENSKSISWISDDWITKVKKIYPSQIKIFTEECAKYLSYFSHLSLINFDLIGLEYQIPKVSSDSMISNYEKGFFKFYIPLSVENLIVSGSRYIDFTTIPDHVRRIAINNFIGFGHCEDKFDKLLQDTFQKLPITHLHTLKNIKLPKTLECLDISQVVYPPILSLPSGLKNLIISYPITIDIPTDVQQIDLIMKYDIDEYDTSFTKIPSECMLNIRGIQHTIHLPKKRKYHTISFAYLPKLTIDLGGWCVEKVEIPYPKSVDSTTLEKGLYSPSIDIDLVSLSPQTTKIIVSILPPIIYEDFIAPETCFDPSENSGDFVQDENEFILKIKEWIRTKNPECKLEIIED